MKNIKKEKVSGDAEGKKKKKMDTGNIKKPKLKNPKTEKANLSLVKLKNQNEISPDSTTLIKNLKPKSKKKKDVKMVESKDQENQEKVSPTKKPTSLKKKKKFDLSKVKLKTETEDQEDENDPKPNPLRKTPKYPGKPPVDPKKLQKYEKGRGVNLKSIKTRTLREKMRNKERMKEKIAEQAARNEILLTEESGFIETDPGETTTQFKQKQIAANVDIASAAKQFNLDLEFGPYYLNFNRNGRHLVLAGTKGHVAALDWVTKKLACEINVMESVHDVCWLHIETMFAVAQKNWVYIYDNQGIELHCLKRMNQVNKLEFLPYHFLLAGASSEGYLTWLDVSIGQFVKRMDTKLGRINVMTQNPANALLCVGDSKGVVSMWSPNSEKPLAKMLCHHNVVSSIAAHPNGSLMATSCADRSVKVWDLRNLSGPVNVAVLSAAADNLSYSQKGLLGASMGNVVQVYRSNENSLKPYTRHVSNWPISDMQFCPFEDVLGIGYTKGYTSVLVPGSAEANFDALVLNPYQTKSQRREAEVKALLDKIQPELITLDPFSIAEVDVPTLQNKMEAKSSLLHIKPKKIDFKPRKSKAKGKGGTAKVIKSKKILKDLSRREAIDKMQKIKKEEQQAKKKKQKAKFGVLDRFLPKQK